jgi:uncharacterized YigZ family protein
MKQPKVSEENTVFKAPVEPASSIYKEKSSKFISLLFPVSTLEEAEEIRKKISKEYHDATHHCFALRIGIGKEMVEKFSDAGEPSHTAGEPILNALKQSGVSNALCIVVRYFGGTKLGTGGLIRAYNKSALSSIESAKMKDLFETEDCILETGFQTEGILRHALSKFSARILKEERTQNGIKLEVEIAKNRKFEFETKAKEIKEKWKNEFIWKWK